MPPAVAAAIAPDISSRRPMTMLFLLSLDAFGSRRFFACARAPRPAI
jgi:hypothetical protein